MTISKEVLHTQGEWVMKPTSASNCYSFSSGNNYIGLFSFSAGRHEDIKEWMATGKANAELICKAVNERQRLIDSNRELLEKLEWIVSRISHLNAYQNINLPDSITDFPHDAHDAINNAKNIQP